MSKDSQKHYSLVTGQVLFVPDGADSMSAMVGNTLLITDNEKVSLKHLGQAQQGLQMNLHKKADGNPYQVVDVIILNITRLGYFTKEEFEKDSMLEMQPKAIEAPANDPLGDFRE